MEESKKKRKWADRAFRAVDAGLRRQSEYAAIQLTDRVFVCRVKDLPEGGVPESGTFAFVGAEVRKRDVMELIDLEAEPAGMTVVWTGGAGPERPYEAVGHEVVEGTEAKERR